MPDFVTRFAPSPTGDLHRGHAFSALHAFEAAQAAGGVCLLRIEDIDATRSRPEFEQHIFEDLAWLGLSWPSPVRRQSEHLADYEAALGRLRAEGLVYRCFRTRREVAEAMASAPHGAMETYRGAPLPAQEEAERVRVNHPASAWARSLPPRTPCLAPRHSPSAGETRYAPCCFSFFLFFLSCFLSSFTNTTFRRSR